MDKITLRCPALSGLPMACDRCIFWPSGPGWRCIEMRERYEQRGTPMEPANKIAVTCPGCGTPVETFTFCKNLRHQCGGCGAFFVLLYRDGWTAEQTMTPEEQSRQGGGWKAKYQQKGQL